MLARFLLVSVALSLVFFYASRTPLLNSLNVTASEPLSFAEANPEILPLVVIQPGETQKLTLTTYCTVGATRGGGFSLAEMRNGVAENGESTGSQGTLYRRDGIEISIPKWQEAIDFTAQPHFAAVKAENLSVFEVTVSASKEAKPGLMNMHLADSTCNGDCHTTFRVLVLAP